LSLIGRTKPIKSAKIQQLKRSLVDLQDHFKSNIVNSQFFVRIISAKKKIKKIVLEKMKEVATKFDEWRIIYNHTNTEESFNALKISCFLSLQWTHFAFPHWTSIVGFCAQCSHDCCFL
jgi:hypothetical protein